MLMARPLKLKQPERNRIQAVNLFSKLEVSDDCVEWRGRIIDIFAPACTGVETEKAISLEFPILFARLSSGIRMAQRSVTSKGSESMFPSGKFRFECFSQVQITCVCDSLS
jgi:hypothetical protein